MRGLSEPHKQALYSTDSHLESVAVNFEAVSQIFQIHLFFFFDICNQTLKIPQGGLFR